MSLYIPIILGTGREGRQSEKVAKFILNEFQKQSDVETELLDVRDYAQPFTGASKENAQKLSQKARRADGFLIVTPEYNHGYPGELKMMLDMLYEEYNRKPVGICGVSAGALGGGRSVEQFRLVAIEFQMVPIREAVYFPTVQTLFDEQGNIKDASYAVRLKKFFEELLWYTRALKVAREQ